jgi:hypothetical protein
MNVTSLASGKRTTSTLFLTNERDLCYYLRPPVRKKKTLLQRVVCSRSCSARELLTVVKGLVLRGYTARPEFDRCEGFGFGWIHC